MRKKYLGMLLLIISMALFAKESIIDEDSYIEKGKIKNNLGKLEEAIEDFTKAIELNPKYIDAYYYRGVSKYELEKEEEAIKDYTKEKELKSIISD